MAPLTFADKHNMVAYLSKSNADNVVKLQALINEKKVVFTEDIIRQDLRLDDAAGVECLPNKEIFAELACRKINFSKYIFNSMVRNVDSPSKFLMYLRFLQVIINNQVDDLSSHTKRYTSPALTQKVFANMRKIRKKMKLTYLLPLPLPSPTNAPSPPPQDPLFTPLQAQPATPSPSEEQPTDTSESSMSILNTLMGTWRIDDVSAAIKDANAVEPIVFDDEEVTLTMD
nr:hypothetical protein [Tanacetum cinerariifolium]